MSDILKNLFTNQILDYYYTVTSDSKFLNFLSYVGRKLNVNFTASPTGTSGSYPSGSSNFLYIISLANLTFKIILILLAFLDSRIFALILVALLLIEIVKFYDEKLVFLTGKNSRKNFKGSKNQAGSSQARRESYRNFRNFQSSTPIPSDDERTDIYCCDH